MRCYYRFEMGMADDIRGMGILISGDMVRLTQGGSLSPTSMADFDSLDEAFSEWDENAPIAQLARGSQPHVLPPSSRTLTLPAPMTTRMLASSTPRQVAPTKLEEALLALTNGVPELISSDC